MNPAMMSLPTEASTMMAYTTMMTEGGIKASSVPPAHTTPAARRLA